MAQSVENSVAALLYRVEHFHWSPMHPTKYVISDGQGGVKGVGLVAHQDYAAFNLAWGMCSGRWKTDADQMNLITAFVGFQQYTSVRVAGEPLGDYLTVLQPRMVPGLMAFRGNNLPPAMQDVVLTAAKMAAELKDS